MQSITDLEYKKIFTSQCIKLKITFHDYLGYKTKIGNDKALVSKSFKQHTKNKFMDLMSQSNSLIKSCTINHSKTPIIYLNKFKKHLLYLEKRTSKQILDNFINDKYHGKLYIEKANKPLLDKEENNYDKSLIKSRKMSEKLKNNNQKVRINKLESNLKKSEDLIFYIIIVFLIIFIGILIYTKGI